MRLLITFCLFVSTATAALGAADNFILPAELELVLPANGKVQAAWVAPPLATDEVAAARLTGQRFRLDRHAATWMLHGKKTITDLDSGHSFSLTRPINDFIWLDNGALFLAGETAIGIIPPLTADKAAAPEVPLVPFQPVVNLPAQQCMLATDGKDIIFAYGYDPQIKGYALFELLKGFSGWRKLFVAADKIADVCVDGQTLYIAAGRTVYRLRPDDNKAAVIFAHPLDNITGLACGTGCGPFYATARGIGAANGLEFVKSNWTQVAVRGDALYLFMTESLGVLRLDGIHNLLEQPK